jgi:hypothetical protein
MLNGSHGMQSSHLDILEIKRYECKLNKTVSHAVAPEQPTLISDDWQHLQQKVAACTACSLHAGRTQTVFGVGNRHADLMIIGEAPGFHEDQQGDATRCVYRQYFKMSSAQ